MSRNRQTFLIPIKIQSEGNKNEHWSLKQARRKVISNAIKYMLRELIISPPCTVILTRIAPRFLDEEDNLRTALKWSKDCVADRLIPDLAPGRADGSKEIKWRFQQEKGKVREYALKIEIVEGLDDF